jgi:L-iditol 2-dehydrogenase
VKLARYMSGGEIAILEEDAPSCPPGGLLVRTEASGLCSGELMDWYMDRKVPHVLGHEVCGVVVESQDARFPIGSRVAPHHHAPCLECDLCRRGAYVHCEQWKQTKLIPGGMAEFFGVPAENLTDTILIDPNPQEWNSVRDLRTLTPADAALIEPLGCVVKSYWRGLHHESDIDRISEMRLAVIGLGFMGLVHLFMHRRYVARGDQKLVGYDFNLKRLAWARDHGFDVHAPDQSAPADLIFVCPGTEEAIRFAIEMAEPGATIVLFSPLAPPGSMNVPVNHLYFKDINLVTSYSCGPDDTRSAYHVLREGGLQAESVVSDFISLDELPGAYKAMRAGEILKPMVLF